jgi:hypothetical protein
MRYCIHKSLEVLDRKGSFWEARGKIEIPGHALEDLESS